MNIRTSIEYVPEQDMDDIMVFIPVKDVEKFALMNEKDNCLTECIYIANGILVLKEDEADFRKWIAECEVCMCDCHIKDREVIHMVMCCDEMTYMPYINEDGTVDWEAYNRIRKELEG